MGAEKVDDKDLTSLGIDIVEKTDSESRKLKIPSEKIEEYKNLIREKMTAGFWNEFLDENNVHFIFKLKNGEVKEYILSPENEQEIDKNCTELNNEPPEKTANCSGPLSLNTNLV